MSTIDAGRVDIDDSDWYVHGTFAAALPRRRLAHSGCGRGDAAVLQPPALLPPHRHRGNRARREADHPPPSQPPPQLGIGAHVCLGAHLARLEARIFFEELLSTFRTIEPAKVRSNLNDGFKRMPVRLAL